MSVLLLNASYEPLRVISWQRAICLQLADRADLVESVPNRALHSSGGSSFPFPSVVRLREMVRVPFRREVPITRKALVARDRGQCQKEDCSRKGSTMDHLLPRSRGGRHDWLNVVLMCHEHNNSKGAHTLEELGWRLKRRPSAPSFETALLGRHHLLPEWLQWLSDPDATQLAAAG
ncbi:MAG: HNH endonuclease [Acidimicrobiales bacterium]|nr:HNH endonuclease [Acidimicrobiales bacterium]RZV47509.1 MAG: HNH endonuclease [Acidimicrobiales bacterium]